MSESVRECPETPWDTWTPPAHLVCPKVCPVCPSVSGQCPASVRGHMSEVSEVSGDICPNVRKCPGRAQSTARFSWNVTFFLGLLVPTDARFFVGIQRYNCNCGHNQQKCESTVHRIVMWTSACGTSLATSCDWKCGDVDASRAAGRSRRGLQKAVIGGSSM